MAALTKAEMAEALFDQLGLNKREARELVDLFFEEIRAALSSGEQVKLSGFGNFDLRVVAGEAIACSADGESLLVEKAADLPNDQHVLALVVAAIAAALDGLELRKLLLPVAQHVRLDAAEVAHLTDGEVALAGDRR